MFQDDNNSVTEEYNNIDSSITMTKIMEMIESYNKNLSKSDIIDELADNNIANLIKALKNEDFATRIKEHYHNTVNDMLYTTIHKLTLNAESTVMDDRELDHLNRNVILSIKDIIYNTLLDEVNNLMETSINSSISTGIKNILESDAFNELIITKSNDLHETVCKHVNLDDKGLEHYSRAMLKQLLINKL